MATAFDAGPALTEICRSVLAVVPSAVHVDVTVDGVALASTGDSTGLTATAVPLRTDDGAVCTLTIHGRGLIVPTGIDALVTVATALVQAIVTIGHLDRALGNRAVIEQAKGILMATHRTSDTGAFRLLVANSQASNRKLHLVAEKFVDDATQ